MKSSRLIFTIKLFLLGYLPIIASDESVKFASSTIERLIGNRIKDVQLSTFQSPLSRDSFNYFASHGKVTIKGSSGVALCRGFYEYMKQFHLAQISWTGNRLSLPAVFPDVISTGGSSPYPFRYYFNVVTYGYSMPYWNWKRWQQEIDWMAFHGINMPLMLVGIEAISANVWQKMGLNPTEVADFYTGPAHLPWQRMGNIYNVDGPLTSEWHNDQRQLAHKILNQMRGLGMSPIVQGFSGFVPRAMAKLYPDIKLSEMSWSDFPKENHTFILSPSSELFKKIQKYYVNEWEKEYGSFDYYLIDSFNEMELPKGTGLPDSVLLRNYGKDLYFSLADAKPGAIWVTQGWTFGYMRSLWTQKNMQALLKEVPNDKMLILDEAEDYNMTFWKNGSNWEYYDAFDQKKWGWGVIPNMGGKTAFTGILSFYANEPFRVLNSGQKGNLTAFGICPEGIENNVVLYELLTDMAWKYSPVTLNSWLKDYCLNRYGFYNQDLEKAWTLLHKSAYTSFTDHPRFGWQRLNARSATFHPDTTFFSSVRCFLKSCPYEKQNSLFQADVIEMVAFAIGLKADECFNLAMNAHASGETNERNKKMNETLIALSQVDRLLESHPLLRLKPWLDFSRSHSKNPQQNDIYEKNARKILTTWGAPNINDYSARVWSGLIRDYYMERLSAYFKSLQTDQKFQRNLWEINWVNSTGISTISPFKDPYQAAHELFDLYY